MKKLFFLLSVFLLSLLVAGCSSVKRFKSATFIEQDNALVDMELFGTRLSVEGTAATTRNLWDLSASAQTQLIQILNERYSDNEQFISSLNNEYLDNDPHSSFDLTRKNLRMVFTISKQRDFRAINEASSRFSPADRIEYLKFTLEIPEKYNLHFIEWDRYVTEYGIIEIADVSFSRSIDLDADGSVEKTDVTGKGSFNRNEEQKIRSRYLKLNGSISDRKIKVEEEGTREIDLTGNVVAEVSLAFKGFPERLTIPLFADEGQEGSGVASVSALKFADVVVPQLEDVPDTIKAIVQLDYIYRHVQSGWKTFQEWDDRVEYYSGSLKKEFPLFKKNEILPTFYGIGEELDGKTLLKVRSEKGIDYPLQFKDLSDANRFLDWLLNETKGREGPVMIGTNTIMFNGITLNIDQVVNANLKVISLY